MSKLMKKRWRFLKDNDIQICRMQDDNPDTPLTEAIERRRLELVRFLAKTKIDIRNRMSGILMRLAMDAGPEYLDIILRIRGLNINEHTPGSYGNDCHILKWAYLTNKGSYRHYIPRLLEAGAYPTQEVKDLGGWQKAYGGKKKKDNSSLRPYEENEPDNDCHYAPFIMAHPFYPQCAMVPYHSGATAPHTTGTASSKGNKSMTTSVLKYGPEIVQSLSVALTNGLSLL